MKEFLESKDTFKKVVEKLNKIYSLNKIKVGEMEKFFICGGSVANIVYSLAHGGKPTINDIDVFIYEKQRGVGIYDWETFEPNEEIEDDGGVYNFLFKQEHNSHYKIIKENREGILNMIKCDIQNNSKMDGPLGKEKRTKRNEDIILGGFDLNCTQIGLDLENGSFIYTEDFLRFLTDKQLKVVAPHTPIQTMVRLHKKLQDLNCYCNLSLEYDFIIKSIFSETKLTFGRKTYDKYLLFKDIIDEHFIIKKIDKEFVDNFFNIVKAKTLSKEVELSQKVINQKFLKYMGYDVWQSGIDDVDLKDTIINHFENIEIWMHVPRKNVLGTFFNNTWDFKKYWELLNRDKSKSDLRKIKTILEIDRNTSNVIHPRPTNESKSKFENLNNLFFVYHKVDSVFFEHTNHITNRLLRNGDFYKCDFTEKHVKWVVEFTKEHSQVFYRFPFTSNLQFIYKELKKLKSLANKKGDWVIGEFEGWWCHDGEYSFERFLELIKEKEKELNTKLVETLDLNGLENFTIGITGYTIKELNTQLKLRSEGKTMGHCVGGYSDTIRRGDSRIFHIECDGIGSTIEIKKGIRSVWPYIGVTNDEEAKKKWEEKSKPKWKVSQHYGRYPEMKGNVDPTKNNMKIGVGLCEFMNEKYPIDETEQPKEISNQQPEPDFIF